MRCSITTIISKAFVLGAGLGTRLKPFTDRTPKPLLPVLGVPCIEFALSALSDAGVREVVVNVHAHAAQMREYLFSCPVPGLKITESNEEALLLGSAGGFRKAIPVLGKAPFLAMNADSIYFPNLQQLVARHESLKKLNPGHRMTLCLVSGEELSHQTGSYREMILDHQTHLILSFGEKRPQVPFYSGVGVFEPSAFSHLTLHEPAEFVPDVLTPAIQQGGVGFILGESPWFDIGSPELWHDAHLRLSQQLNNLPKFAQDLIRAKDPTLNGRFTLGKTSIQLDDLKYEIKSIRTP